MVTRTVTVRLRADINQYTRGMRTAADSTSRLAGAGATVSTALVTGFALAAASAAKFDKALSNVRAVTGASAADMAKLRAAALDAGKSTAYSATEAANAEADLARAGVSVANITGGALAGSLSLAASGQIDLSESATIAAQTMNTFGLKGKDVSHIADVLSASANKSASDVHGLGESLRMGGLLANQTGLSLEETVGTLSAFADHALIGSDAGTSLKTMLQRLTPQSKEAQAAMDKIGLSAYDSSGQFVGLSEFAGRLKTSFSKLTPEARNSAMATIFGSDAVRSATILYELGSQGVDKYVASVNDQGAAQRMASIQMDNLMGDLQRLRGAIEVALIEGGSAANGILRTMAQWVTRVVNAYNSLPAPLQHAVTLLGGLAGVLGLAATGFLLLLPRIAATRAALTSMGVTAASSRAALLRMGQIGMVFAAISTLSIGLTSLMKRFQESPPSVAKLTSSLIDFARNGKVAGEMSRVAGQDLDGFGDAVSRIAHPGVGARILDSAVAITNLGMNSSTALSEARDKVKGFDDALAGLVQGGNSDIAAQSFQQLAVEAQAHGTSIDKLRGLLPQYSEALAGTDVQQKLAADGQGKLGDEAAMTADELANQKSAAEQLTDALKTLNGIAITGAEKEIAFRQSLADLTTAVDENGHSMDVTSEKGRKVKSAFLDAAQGAMEHAQAVAEQKNSVEAGNDALEADIVTLKKTMSAAGFSKDAIDKLTAAYTQLPVTASTKVDAKTQGALTDLERVQRKLAGTKDRSVTVSALTKDAEKRLRDMGFKVTHMKDGNVKITIPTGPPKKAAAAIQAAIDGLHGKNVSNIVTTFYRAGNKPTGGPTAGAFTFNKSANGSIQRGGMQLFAGGAENHVAQIAPGGTWRVWAEPETGGESYIPLSPSKRGRSRQIAEETVRRLGGKGIAWNAQGAISRFASGGFTYNPTSAPALGGPSDARTRFDDLVGKLRTAWSEYNAAVKSLNDVKKNKKSTKAQRTAAQKKVNAEYADVKSLDSQLGLPSGAKAPTVLNLTAYQKQLGLSLAATSKWRANLTKIAGRGGEDIRALLEGMGEGGYSLVNALAGASTKQFNDITTKLLKTGETAKATLADFVKQLGASTKVSTQFGADLQALAARGFGDLAQALAAQGDPAAQALARQAVTGSAKDVAAANAAVKGNTSVLSGEDLSNALVLLSTLRAGPGRGYAELIAAGLDTSVIKALVPRMLAQINSLPTANKQAFLRQFAGQGGGMAMARGGILTRPTAVLGGEAGVPESWIPHDGSARSRALLAKTGALMGYRMTPASRYASLSSASQTTGQGDHHATVNLYGAKQSSAEQAMDVARHMQLIG